MVYARSLDLTGQERLQLGDVEVAQVRFVTRHEQLTESHDPKACSCRSCQIERSEVSHETPVAFIGGSHSQGEGFQRSVLPFRDPIAIAEHDRHFCPASQKKGSMDGYSLPGACEMREYLAWGPSTSIWPGVEYRFKVLQDALYACPRLLHGYQNILFR